MVHIKVETVGQGVRKSMNQKVGIELEEANIPGTKYLDTLELMRHYEQTYPEAARLADEGLLNVSGRFPKIYSLSFLQLHRPPRQEEIKEVLFSMDGFKAPIPDSLHALFFQSQWNSLNNSVIKLVQDEDNPDSIRKLRPISLCNVVLKAITKIMANRLKPRLGNLIMPNQCGFIKGRHNSNNIIIAQEVMHSMKMNKGKVGWMIVKVDLEKAYNRINWVFLRNTLDEVGLHQQTIELIMEDFSYVSMSVLWEGAKTEEFTPTRGIRLAHMILEVMDKKIWRPIILRKGGPLITHLLFADDLLLFAEAPFEQAKIINGILRCFCESSRKRISKEKTRVFLFMNVNHTRANEIAQHMQFPIAADLGRYLGIPLLSTRVNSSTFNHVLQRVNKRLNSRQMNSLYLAGRATLIQSVFAATPFYTMQTCLLPGSSREKRRIHPVAWEKVCKSKRNGGIGLRKIRETNQAFMMKIGHGLLTYKDRLWAKVLRNKYKVNDDLLPELKTVNRASNLWKGISKVWSKVIDGFQIQLGDGLLTNFCGENWFLGNIKVQLKQEVVIFDEVKGWKVSDFVDEQGNLKWSTLEQLVTPATLAQIANIMPPTLTKALILSYRATLMMEIFQ
ncbi:uncharacterized protein LOC133293425 [Gastrolobium bilobum]|uniref:uncharacterized protein LOC133293425 n=1 Tax=Gastrolobium bilobum TaxID=150636 RepID=UPI002AB01FB8|nr:uncharacterized protein LOC133293425 [Gastrolobium bilobum]